MGTLTLTGQVQGQSLLVARHIGEGSARVVIGALGSERHTAGHLRVGPDLAFKRLNLEDFVLEEHLVLLDGFPDAHVLAAKGGDGTLFASVHFRLRLRCIV